MGSSVRFDAVVAGSGINSMVAGALLERSGWTVCALERSDYLGLLPDGRTAFLSRLAEVNAATFDRISPGDGAAWVATLKDFRSDEVHALWAPWVLHTGMGPDEATSGLTLQVMAMMLQDIGMPSPIGGGSKLIEAFAAIITKRGGQCLTDVDVVLGAVARVLES